MPRGGNFTTNAPRHRRPRFSRLDTFSFSNMIVPYDLLRYRLPVHENVISRRLEDCTDGRQQLSGTRLVAVTPGPPDGGAGSERDRAALRGHDVSLVVLPRCGH